MKGNQACPTQLRPRGLCPGPALLGLQAGARTPSGARDFDSEPHTCITSTFQALSYLPSESLRKINVCVGGGGSNISKIINVRGGRGNFFEEILVRRNKYRSEEQ